LKPENLLLDDKKNIKIIDFGFGNNYRDDELLDTFCGLIIDLILGRHFMLHRK
jgi:serine/threonine protein kinase